MSKTFRSGFMIYSVATIPELSVQDHSIYIQKWTEYDLYLKYLPIITGKSLVDNPKMVLESVFSSVLHTKLRQHLHKSLETLFIHKVI